MSANKPIQKLTIPEFKSDLPLHLLKDCSDQEVYIMEQLSISKQQTEWLIEAVQDVHFNQQITQTTVNDTVVRLDGMDENRKLFKTKPMMVAVAIVAFTFLFIVYPYLLSLEFQELLPLIKGFFL